MRHATVLAMNATSKVLVPATAALLIALVGCSAPATPHQEPAPVKTDAAPSAEATEEAPAAGTRDNPIPIDTLTEYDVKSQWRFSIGATNPDATAEIAKDSPSTPPEGKVFILAPFYVQVKDTGTQDGAVPSQSLNIQYVTAKGNTFSADGVDCYGMGMLYGVESMYPGAEATANICAAVPADDVVGGVWRVASWSQPDSFIFLDGAN